MVAGASFVAALGLASRARVPEIPTPIDWIGASVNLNPSVLRYPAERISRDLLVTDLIADEQVFPAKDPRFPTARTAYEGGLPAIQRRAPAAMIGTYISGTSVKDDDLDPYYPPSKVARRPFEDLCAKLGCDRGDPRGVFKDPDFNSGEEKGRAVVNLAHEAAGRLLVDMVFEEVVSRERPLVLVDNIAFPTDDDPTWIPWEVQTAWLATLRNRLHGRSIRMLANVAVNLPRVAETDLQRLERAVDGITLEQPLHANNRRSRDLLERAIANDRYLLDRGAAVVLIPLCANQDGRACTDGETSAEVRMIIGFAAAVYEPGDRLFVHHAFFEEADPWLGFPAIFGKPLARAVVSDPDGDDRSGSEPTVPPQIRRAFENGTLVVTPSTREATFVAKQRPPDRSARVDRRTADSATRGVGSS